MTNEERGNLLNDVGFRAVIIRKSIQYLQLGSFEEYKEKYANNPNYRKYTDDLEELKEFFNPVSEQQQKLLQEILDKVDNTLTTTNYVPGSRVKTLEDLNAFLEYIIPFWISMQQALRNTDALQNNGII